MNERTQEIGFFFFRRDEPSSFTSSPVRTGAPIRDDNNGVLGALADLTVYDNPPSPEPPIEESILISRQGKTGTR